MLKLEENSIFIADAHFNFNRQNLRELLLQLLSNKIKTSQLFLMGDMFDFLSNEIKFFKIQNQEIINLINHLSLKINIIYLEGNHDFNLQRIFPKVQVISRQKQPLMCNYDDKTIAISHGDIYTPIGYNIYTTIIRNTIFLKFLNLIDINFWLSNKINNWLLQKDICNKCQNFETFSKKRVALYPQDVDMIIEGHFHYGEQTHQYINIPSLACDTKYYKLNHKIFQKLSK